MKTASIGEVQANLGEFVKASAKQPLLILRDEEPVAVLVGLGHSKPGLTKLRDVLKRAWKEYEANGGIAHEDFWNNLAESGNSLSTK